MFRCSMSRGSSLARESGATGAGDQLVRARLHAHRRPCRAPAARECGKAGRRLVWYRDGTNGWEAAKLPIMDAEPVPGP